MKKKMKAVLCVSCIAMGLSGCGNAIPDMTKEQSAIVAEYAAGLLLKYDKHYESRLVEAADDGKVEEISGNDSITEEIVEEEKKQEADTMTVSENQAESSTVSSAVANENIKIEDFLGLDSVQIDYAGYEIMDSYLEGNGTELAFAMDASEGAKLVVAKFKITNIGTEDTVCDMFSKNVRFRIHYGTESKNVLVTMLSDDFATLNTTISAGDSITAVLIIEVKSQDVQNMGDLSLEITYNGNHINTLLESEASHNSVVEQQADVEQTIEAE